MINTINKQSYEEKQKKEIFGEDQIVKILDWETFIDSEKKTEYQTLLNYVYLIRSKNKYLSLDEEWRELYLSKLQDNYEKYITEREFIDALIESDDDVYISISNFITIPPKILKLREKYKIIKEIQSKLLMYQQVKTWQRWKDKDFITEDLVSFIEKYKNNSIFKYIMINTVNNWHYRNFQKDFNLPKEFERLRDTRDGYILKNVEKFDSEQIKDALCDLLFADNMKNLTLKIDTILDREKFVPDFLDKKNLEIMFLIKEFIALERDNKEQIWKLVQKLIERNEKLKDNWLSLKTLVENCLGKARSDFQEDIKKTLKEANIFNGEVKELETTSWKKVKFYKINDTSDTDVLLVRSLKGENLEWKLCKKKYDEYLSREKKSWFSYSLISTNRTEESIFNMGVTFWFLWLWNNDVKFANTFDSDSWSCPFPKCKQQFFPIQKFLEYTENHRHNELFISNDEKIYPDYIISRDDSPAQELVDLAYDFWIPIVLNNASWKSSPNGKYKKSDFWEWDYRNGFPKYRWIVSISQLLEQF